VFMREGARGVAIWHAIRVAGALRSRVGAGWDGGRLHSVRWSSWAAELRILVVLLLLPALPQVPLRAAEPQLRITRDISVSEDRSRLRVVVEPRDDAGRPLRDLPSDHFVATVDGVAPPAITVEKTTADVQPLATVLTLDVSKSMVKGNALGAASDSSMALTQNMLPADQACLVIFGDSVRVLSECTVDKAYVQRIIVGLFPTDNKTLLYDGLLRAAELATKATTSRAVVIALTDGKDEGSGSTLEDVARRFQETGIPLYAFGFGPHADTKTLQRLASLAGGEYHYAVSSEELPTMYRSIWEHLKNHYALDISVPSLPPGRHRVEVGLAFRGQTIRSSKDVVVPSAPAPKWLWIIVGAVAALALLLVGLSAAVVRARKRRSVPSEPVLPPVWLEVTSGPQSGRRLHFTSDVFRIGPKLPPGPAAGRLFLPSVDLEVKKSHDGTFLITDKGSSNGMRLNGVNVRSDQGVRLRDGDRIAAAGTEFVFRDRRLTVNTPFGLRGPTIGQSRSKDMVQRERLR
jgi:Mg-chelatase subunit ChlD